MAKKKTKLAEVFNPENDLQPKPELEVVEPQPTSDRSKVAPSREQKKHIGGYFNMDVYRQLKHLGVEEDMTMQEMLAASINALFEMHDKPPIA